MVYRFGYDAALIKENHIASAGSISAAVESLRRNNLKTIEVEVENLDQLKEAITSFKKLLPVKPEAPNIR